MVCLFNIISYNLVAKLENILIASDFKLEVVKGKSLCASQEEEVVKSLKLLQKNLINKIYTDSAQAKIPAVLDYLGTIIESLLPGRNSSAVVKTQLNNVAIDGSSNASATPTDKSGVPNADARNAKPSSDVSPPALATEESISEFLNQVSSLVKLVDSRDILELHLKQLDCELVIRKKEALPQPPSAAPVVMMQSPSQPPVMPPSPSVPSPVPAPSGQASAAPTPVPSPAAPKSAKSSLPPLKSPMAGTFYKSPAPGEPPFVKVGDKVQKGQILCIIEAMKLMNEIEADQSGTILEIIAEDGKQVSVDTPLFVIEP